MKNIFIAFTLLISASAFASILPTITDATCHLTIDGDMNTDLLNKILVSKGYTPHLSPMRLNEIEPLNLSYIQAYDDRGGFAYVSQYVHLSRYDRNSQQTTFLATLKGTSIFSNIHQDRNKQIRMEEKAFKKAFKQLPKCTTQNTKEHL